MYNLIFYLRICTPQFKKNEVNVPTLHMFTGSQQRCNWLQSTKDSEGMRVFPPTHHKHHLSIYLASHESLLLLKFLRMYICLCAYMCVRKLANMTHKCVMCGFSSLRGFSCSGIGKRKDFVGSNRIVKVSWIFCNYFIISNCTSI